MNKEDAIESIQQLKDLKFQGMTDEELKKYLISKVESLQKDFEYYVSIQDREKGECARGRIDAYTDILNKFVN